jgi:hypothetical protein
MKSTNKFAVAALAALIGFSLGGCAKKYEYNYWKQATPIISDILKN